MILGAHSPFPIAANYRRLVQEAEPKVRAQQQDALPDSKPQSQRDRCHPPNGCSVRQARWRAAEPPATPFAMVRDRPRNNDAPTSVADPDPRASAPKSGSMAAPSIYMLHPVQDAFPISACEEKRRAATPEAKRRVSDRVQSPAQSTFWQALQQCGWRLAERTQF